MKTALPVRVTRSYVQRIHARPEDVFPLLCPVRETEWAAGWDPKIVLSYSGLAEPDCIFITTDPQGNSVWVTTRYEPETYSIEFIKITPGYTAGRIQISLTLNENSETDAVVTSSFTALGPEGENFIKGYTEGYYQDFMRQWERELNDYLRRHAPAPEEKR